MGLYPLVAMVTSLERSGKRDQIDNRRSNTYHMVKNGENRPSRSEIAWLKILFF